MRHSALFFAVLVAGCGGSTSAEAPVEEADSATETSAIDNTGVASDDTSIADDSPTEDVAAEGATDSGTPKGDSTTTMTACISAVTAGTTVIKCEGFAYDVTVPDACTSGGCGIVLDVHGLSMSGKMEDNNTAMRALGVKHGYVIVQPNANPAPPSSSWTPGTDDDKVFAFLKQAITAFGIDAKRVHMTGFSQGGMMTSRMLCKHADVWASVAPAAGTGCTFAGVDTPSREVHTLYMHGTSDALVAFSVGKSQVDAAVAKWKMTAQPDVESDGKHAWHRWKSPAGTVLEFVQHDYSAASFVLKGHCYPGQQGQGRGARPALPLQLHRELAGVHLGRDCDGLLHRPPQELKTHSVAVFCGDRPVGFLVAERPTGRYIRRSWRSRRPKRPAPASSTRRPRSSPARATSTPASTTSSTERTSPKAASTPTSRPRRPSDTRSSNTRPSCS